MFFNPSPTIATLSLHPAIALTAHILLALALVLAIIRFVKGPDTVDRLVCLDLIAGVILGLNLLQSIIQADINFMNVALTLAVVAFISTTATARYLERKAHSPASPIK